MYHKTLFVIDLKLLVNFLSGKGHPLINRQSSVISWVILLKQGLILSLRRNREIVLLWHSEELVHHCWELRHLDDPVHVRVMVSEDLQHVPIQLHLLRTGSGTDGNFDELLELLHTSMVNDGVRIHGGSLGSNVLLAELEPFIKCDDTSGLEIHGVKHLLPGCILLCLGIVKIGIFRSIPISSGHRCGSVDQLGERSSADETILVGVSIHKQLQERVVHLGVRVALLVIDSLLHEPDEVFLGLVKSVDWARHLG